MRKLALVLFLLPYCIHAQGWVPTGARSGGLLNASTTLTDQWAYFNNPGALGKQKSFSMGISYENRFLLQDLQRQSIAIAAPTKYGVFSFGSFYQGSTNLKNFRSGLGYALKIAENFSAGVQLNYQALRLPSYYGSSNTVTAEAGFLFQISSKWNVGASIFNLGQSKLSEFQDDRYNSTLRIGAGFLPSKTVKILAEVWKDIDGPVSFKGAMEYEAFKNFHLRLGVGNQPTSFAFGFGYKWKEFSFDCATSYHQVLGFSPQITFNYEKKKAK